MNTELARSTHEIAGQVHPRKIKPMVALAILLSGSLPAAEWRLPNRTPLHTRWTEQVSPLSALPEYPRPSMTRDAWLNLNGVWDYAVTGREAGRPSEFTGHILVPYPIESALSGVMKPLLPDQRLWYRRSFSVPTVWQGQRVLLRFGAVDWQCEIWLNGKSLGSHRGGYDAFSFDLTERLKPEAANQLVVAVLDPTDSSWQLRGKQTLRPGGAAYTASSGIWQTVWLEPVPYSSVEKLKLVPDLSSGALQLSVTGRTPPGKTVVEVSVSDGEQLVSSAKTVLGRELNPAILENLAWYKARSIGVIADVSVSIPQARLWTPDDPFLYNLTVELKDDNGRVLDRVKSYFGMRSLAVGHDERGNTRLMLNGKPFLLAGALDQGFWPDGIYAAPTDEALRFDVEAAKRLGLNSIRKHIKIEPERYYYWCDRLGLLVLQDLPSGYAGDPFTDAPTNPEGALANEMEMRTLIQQRWNHPSIIMWNMFNEGWGQFDTLRFARWAKELDPSRLINEASGFPRHGGGDVLDVHGGVPPREPNRISIDSETAGNGLSVPGHQWPGKGWATGTYDPETGGETTKPFPALYPLDDAAKNWYTHSCKNLYRLLWADSDATGCSGYFKVQLYDLETEMNGMLSYDRAVWKVVPEDVARAARGESLSALRQSLVPTTLTAQSDWQYTTTRPTDDWIWPVFDASEWKTGQAGFGGATGGARSGTPWSTSDIWLRKEFTIEHLPTRPVLRVVHDEDIEVFINGELAMREGGFTSVFDDYEIAPKALAALRAGRNVIAVHCRQTTGGQFVDVGLVDVKE